MYRGQERDHGYTGCCYKDGCGTTHGDLTCGVTGAALVTSRTSNRA